MVRMIYKRIVWTVRHGIITRHRRFVGVVCVGAIVVQVEPGGMQSGKEQRLYGYFLDAKNRNVEQHTHLLFIL